MSIVRLAVAIETRRPKRLDCLLAPQGPVSRWEVARDVARKRLVEGEASQGRDESVAMLTLACDRAQHELSGKTAAAGHEQHTRELSRLHVHLDDHLRLGAADARRPVDWDEGCQARATRSEIRPRLEGV
jgi:metal-responsive CopG/Arc/MetJ family transcriptional regulator